VLLRKQDALREFVAASRLPVLEIDMSDGDMPAACATITEMADRHRRPVGARPQRLTTRSPAR